MSEAPAVLVVEDERNLCRVIEAKLRRAGYVVTVAFDATSGTTALLQGPFDAVLLDVHLPDAEAIDLLPRLRRAVPSTPFILMTAYEEEDLRARALVAGASDVLFKPFDLDRMVAAVQLNSRGATAGRDHSAALASIVALGQAVTVAAPSMAPEKGLAAHVTANAEDAFAVVLDEPSGLDFGPRPVVTIVGEDGLYQFRSRLLRDRRPQGALILSKPTAIQRRQRRRSHRIELSVPIRIVVVGEASRAADPRSRAHAEVTGRAADLSAGGAAMILPKAVPPGTPVEAVIPALPGDDPDDPVVAAGDVVRCEPVRFGPSAEAHKVAVRFTRVVPRIRARIRRFVAQRAGLTTP